MTTYNETKHYIIKLHEITDIVNKLQLNIFRILRSYVVANGKYLKRDKIDVLQNEIFHDEEECGVSDQEASGYEVPEKLSTKTVHRNSSSSKSFSCSSSSALLTTSYVSKQTVPPVLSRQFNKININ
ncbi:hypothetical protein MN116_007254 [Schistosoma mekongi]|uniref:Uncharacterized protein n=1 Tax=Schistosoma mekongi TaxID=38744 RepID=A0AAE1Z8T6_SCHME|nr:hypothetical protein MN116_007254 [Schistosoma mekongi]